MDDLDKLLGELTCAVEDMPTSLSAATTPDFSNEQQNPLFQKQRSRAASIAPKAVTDSNETVTNTEEDPWSFTNNLLDSRASVRPLQPWARSRTKSATDQPTLDSAARAAADATLPKKIVAAPMCAKCREPITGPNVVKAMGGKTFHPDHFICAARECGKAIMGSPFVEKDGLPYCTPCFHSHFSPRCAFCSDPIVDRCISALGMNFHPEHFFCGQCGVVFGPGQPFLEVGGKAYCQVDYMSLFAQRCADCDGPLVEDYVSACGRTFHLKCFRCTDKPVCEKHYNARREAVCSSCQKMLVGSCVKADGSKYHKGCWVCSFCRKGLPDSSTSKDGYKNRHLPFIEIRTLRASNASSNVHRIAMVKGSDFKELNENDLLASAPINVREEGISSTHHSTIVTPAKRGEAHGKKGKVKRLDVEEHLMTVEQVCELHKTEVDLAKPASSIGLRAGVATERLITYGPNVLKPPPRKHWILRFMECLLNLFNILLMIAATGTYILFIMDPLNNFQNSYIGAILFGVAFINAGIEFYQLQKSAAILDSFMNMVPSKSNVIRHGLSRQVPAAELVPGDVVFIRMGDKIPADVYLFNVSDLKVDNSSLTGESEPQERKPSNNQKNPLEATNLAFNGTLAVSGEAYGIVIRTGDSTVLGQIAGLTTSESKRESPLALEIERFCKIISFFAFSTAVTFFFICLFRSGNLNYSLSFAIGILVAWVPQGLPATVTMLLTIAAKRMAGMNVLVKDLQGVETLGAITMLCTDKTGTLTRNQMTVTNIWCDGVMWIANGKPDEKEKEKELSLTACGVPEIMYTSALCSRARFNRTDVAVEKREIIGDATESGLLRFVAVKLSNYDKINDEFPKVFEIPFNSDTKTHMSINKKAHAGGSLTLFMKGAPERILRNCSTILRNGESIPITTEHKNEFTIAYEKMAGKGHRVLAFAQLLMPEGQFPADTVFTKEQINAFNYSDMGLCFVGLTSLEDPPKHGVREAVGSLRTAGIKVVMVTGDHPLTAEAIGRKINLMIGDTKERLAKKTGRDIDDIRESECPAIVIHGETIPDLTEDDWDNIFSKDEIIFARTSPKNKLDIVKRAQQLGHIVGVTGDGVNDSPALKKADLGIAMNNSGSDVSKEAAAMILLDDNFATIVHGITEGRLIFMNLKKSIQYAVTHIIPEVIPYLLYVVVPIPLALTAIQILVIDLGFELFAALSFAWEPPETKEGLMIMPPRKPVTAETIKKLRRKLIERRNAGLLPPPPDPERGEDEDEFAIPSRWRRYAHELRMMTYARYWQELFGRQDGEVLVDGEVLSWSYLEAGSWECLGALTTFFTVLWYSFGIDPVTASNAQAAGGYYMPHSPNMTLYDGYQLPGDQQWEGIKQSQSAFYLSVLIIQMWNLFCCKARIRLPFGRFMVKNEKTWYSLLAGLFFGVLIVYTPFMNVIFGTSMSLHPSYLAVPFGFGFVLLVYRALRRVFLSTVAPAKRNKAIENLQMYPTRWSLTNVTEDAEA
ncbi:hypothetical protein HK101_005662 [Irineochytrium annulatum]|nr:hypothetical protein HK101_005662 [Irineochytrium annulatum]